MQLYSISQPYLPKRAFFLLFLLTSSKIVFHKVYLGGQWSKAAPSLAFSDPKMWPIISNEATKKQPQNKCKKWKTEVTKTGTRGERRRPGLCFVVST